MKIFVSLLTKNLRLAYDQVLLHEVMVVSGRTEYILSGFMLSRENFVCDGNYISNWDEYKT